MDRDRCRSARLDKGISSSRPTRVRWRIMIIVILTLAVATLGRLNLGILAKYIQDEFAFGTQTMGWIFTAFSLAYHPFQIPGGWAGDRFGPRRILTFSILLWAAATAAIALLPVLALSRWLGLAWSFATLRFLIGMGEAPASPNTAKVVASWMGPVRRGLGVSFHIVGIGLGGTFAPMFVTWLAQQRGWRTCFYLSSLLGVLVALLWWFYTSDFPEHHGGVNAAELALIRPSRMESSSSNSPNWRPHGRPPWGRMLTSVSVWAMLLSFFCQGYMPYIYVTWFFIYLVRVRGLTMLQGGFWGSTPFIAIMLLAPLGGWFSDFAVAKFGKRRGRQTTVWIGMGCSAILLWTGSHMVSNVGAILMLALAAGFNFFAASSWWATCIDLTPTYSGSLSGLMNTFSGAWLAPIATAYIATHFGWTKALDFAAMLTAIGAILWIFVDASDTLEEKTLISAAG
jgi:ACS family glucarate transporter-like MFS transporter